MDGPLTKLRSKVQFPTVTENPGTPRQPTVERLTELAPALAATAAALHTISWCLAIALAYSYEFSLTCGTGMESLLDTLTGVVPFTLAVPFAGWFVAAKTGVAVPLARCSAITALLVWLTVLILMQG
jgi:hypothetical protein